MILLLSWAFAAIVNQSVGSVDDTIYTSRQVQVSQFIEATLFGDKKKIPHEIRPGQEEFANSVSAFLLEVVVAKEAENFSVTSLIDDEVVASLRRVEDAGRSRDYWQKLNVSSSELRRMVRQKMMAKNFISYKANSLEAVISDQEAQAYYNDNRQKFSGVSFGDFKENIKTFLAQQQLEERLRDWFDVIRKKHKVRNLL